MWFRRFMFLVSLMLLGTPLCAQNWETLSTGTKAEVQSMLDQWPQEEESLEEFLGATYLLFFAAMNPHPEVFDLFLERGLSVDARDEDGWTPLMAMVPGVSCMFP